MSIAQLPDNILLIDKPAGMTSFDVIRQLRRQTGVRKFGHAGTLDPLATGLLVLGVGPGTKQLAHMVGLDKEYVAEILLGQSRRTSDMEGEIIECVSISAEQYTDGMIAEAIQSLVGTHDLPVSLYSAIKKDGVPLYKHARRAEQRSSQAATVEIPYRRMTVYQAESVSIAEHKHEAFKHIKVQVRFSVTSGTYIRSLAEELGRLLDVPAVLYSLRRTRVGDFMVEDAVQPGAVTQLSVIE